MVFEPSPEEAARNVASLRDPAGMRAAIQEEKRRRAAANYEQPKPAENVVQVPDTVVSAGGTESEAANREIVLQTMSTVTLEPQEGPQPLLANIDLLRDVGAKGAVEAMLAAQLVATHNAAMEAFKRAAVPNQVPAVRDASLLHANRLTRSYAALVQTLNKHRGRGQQTVRVEHVHVYEGGQAIVGAVSHDGRRREQEEAEIAVARAGVGRGVLDHDE